MAITVSTFAEVPDANGYIVEVGLEGTDHPANQIDRDRIRDELDIGEWYIQTEDQTEEQELIVQVEEEIDYSRLPAYLVLTKPPEEAEDAVVIYLDEIDSKDTAWELLQIAIIEMRELNENTDSSVDASLLARKIIEEYRSEAITIAVGVLPFVLN